MVALLIDERFSEEADLFKDIFLNVGNPFCYLGF